MDIVLLDKERNCERCKRPLGVGQYAILSDSGRYYCDEFHFKNKGDKRAPLIRDEGRTSK